MYVNYSTEKWNPFVWFSWLCNLLNWHLRIHLTHTASYFGKNFWRLTVHKGRDLCRPFELTRQCDHIQPLPIPNQDTSYLSFYRLYGNLTLNLTYMGNIELKGWSRQSSREMDPSLHKAAGKMCEGMKQNLVLRPVRMCEYNVMCKGVSSLED